MVIETKVLIDWLIRLNYNFEWDRLINLSDNKLSNNNLAIE